MAKNLGGAVIALLEHERVDLRAAAITVLAAVGKADAAVEQGLIGRLADADPVVRRLALEALVEHGATGIAAQLVAILKRDDEALAERAAQVLATQGAVAEGPLRKELGHGPVGARRAIAQLLVKRTTASAIDALLDQLGDHELGEQVLQLVRHELDAGDDKLAELVWKAASARVGDAGKRLDKELARVEKDHAKAAPAAKKGKAAAAPAPFDPTRDAAVAPILAEHTALLRLLGYLARPQSQGLLVAQAQPGRPRPVRFAAIAALRRIVAASEARSTLSVWRATAAMAVAFAPGTAERLRVMVAQHLLEPGRHRPVCRRHKDRHRDGRRHDAGPVLPGRCPWR